MSHPPGAIPSHSERSQHEPFRSSSHHLVESQTSLKRRPHHQYFHTGGWNHRARELQAIREHRNYRQPSGGIHAESSLTSTFRSATPVSAVRISFLTIFSTTQCLSREIGRDSTI